MGREVGGHPVREYGEKALSRDACKEYAVGKQERRREMGAYVVDPFRQKTLALPRLFRCLFWFSLCCGAWVAAMEVEEEGRTRSRP